MFKHSIETKYVIISILIGVSLPFHIFAQAPSSTNFRLENSEFDYGGGNSTSTNYGSRDSLGGVDTSKATSSGFRLFPAGLFSRFPGVPATPTFVNTGGVLYGGLDFIVNTGGNSSDVNYAIAISTDNFSTTNYIQTDDTIGTTAAWQSYINWGSSVGQRVTGLLPNTTYYIKVKARYGVDSETAFSNVASASTVNPTLTVTIEGLTSGSSVGTAVTNIATTASTVPFSNLQAGSIKIGAQKITVTSNAVAGYTTTIMQDTNLSKTNGTQISAVAAPNSAPAAWPSGITDGKFGYHTTDATLCIGTAGRFSADDTFAALTSSGQEVSCNTGPVTSEITNVVFKVEIASLQASGDYRNKITYITTAQY